MTLKFSLCSALVGILSLSPAFAKDKIFQAGKSRQGGQVVNCYTNLGSVHVKKRAKVYQGAVTNVAPDLRLNVIRKSIPVVASAAPSYAAPASIPVYNATSTSLFSFAETAYQRLSPRWANYYSWDAENKKWNVNGLALNELIEQQAREYGIDPLIIECIIHQESNFDPNAVSGVGARGLMQLMPETAADLGVTDPYDPGQNVAAGVRYFVEQYRRFGSIELALAAYNAGPGNVEAYGGVPPFEETQNYVANIAGEYLSRRKRRV